MNLPSNGTMGATALLLGIAAAAASVLVSPPGDLLLIPAAAALGCVALAAFFASQRE